MRICIHIDTPLTFISTNCELSYVEPCHEKLVLFCRLLTLNLIETPFDAFANRVDPNQAALKRAA